MQRRFWTAMPLAASLAAPLAHASCGSAFCSVNTNWDLHGARGEPGSVLDLRYEDIKQDQPRSGSDKVDVGQVPRHHDEVFTKNRNWLASFDYTFDAHWGLNVQAPLVDREHLHIHNHQGAQLPESWTFSGLGDVRVLGRYNAVRSESRDPPERSFAGINFGLKLPTGAIDKRNGDGELAERTLQPGTGSTDALLGAYYVAAMPLQALSWFAQAQIQAPISSRDGYKPGGRLTADIGLRYDLSERASLLLQANFLARGRDSGVNAEPEDSGGRAIFLSPGASVSLTRDIRVYGFLQLPLYQYVNGVQLTADKAALIGASARF